MTNAHCHLTVPAQGARRILCAASSRDWDALAAVCAPDVAFWGIHPWYAAEATPEALSRLQEILVAHPHAGVGEIGLDRLHEKVISDRQRDAFGRQLELAADLHRPVTLHGAKCWGEVVAACRPFVSRIPAFLFHGFSRSAGLLPAIIALNGYVSVGTAVLNDHAVNYRTLVKELPADRLLIETDDDAEHPLADVLALVANLRGTGVAELEGTLEANAARFLEEVR